MSVLATQQQALLDALFARPAANAIKTIAACAMDTGARGLKAYQTNGHMLAERALQSAYPVLAQLIGEDSFADLARALWHAQPPVLGDVACWGKALPEFVRSSAQLQDEPYLPDVAAIEWALHRCATAPDADVQLHTLALLTTVDPADLQLKLTPGCAVLRSPWPAASVVGAHLYGSPSFAEVGALLRGPVAQDAVVWRDGFRPRVRVAQAGEADFLAALLLGHSLADALDASAALEFSAWLPLAAQSGLLSAAIQTSFSLS